jgi:hypothetical protein
MKKLQQGGVYDVNVGTQGTDIPALGLPESPTILPFTGREIVTLARYTKAQKEQEERDSLAEQRYQDSLVSTFMDLNDSLVGELHTQKQRDTVAALKKEYGIPDKFSADILNNPFQLKDMKQKLGLLKGDYRLNKIFHEVAEAKGNRELAERTLFGEDFVKWSEDAWGEYLNGGDAFKTSPGFYKPEKKSKTVNFNSAIQGALPNLVGVDLDDPTSLRDMENVLVSRIGYVDTEAAIAEGFLEERDGHLRLSPAKLNEAISDVRLRQQTALAKREAGVEDYKEKRDYSDAIADENRIDKESGKGKSAPKTKSGKTLEDLFPNLVTAAAIQTAGVIYDRVRKAVPGLNEEDEALLLGVENTVVNYGQGERRDEAIADLVEDLKAKLAKERQRMANEISKQKAMQGAPGAPAKPATTTPTKTAGDFLRK